MNEKVSLSLKVVRIVATFMIFLCHVVCLFGGVIALSAQFFNIGVNVFFILSAYLFSSKDGINDKIFPWYKRRLIRIGIPYYIMMLIMFIICIIAQTQISADSWIGSLFFLQGLTEKYLPGAGHLWYLTAIIICYLITPLLYKLKNINIKKQIFFLIASILIYVPIAFICKDIYGTIYNSVLIYVIAFFVVRYVAKIKQTKRKNSVKLFACLFSMICFVLLKYIFNIYFDGTELYEKILVPLTSQLIGYSIFISIFLFSYIVVNKLKRIEKTINFFDSISFEFYLTHYFIINGPISVNFINNTYLKIFIIFVMSVFTAYIIHLLSKLILKVIK